MSVNIAQYPITQYQYRSNPTKHVWRHWLAVYATVPDPQYIGICICSVSITRLLVQFWHLPPDNKSDSMVCIYRWNAGGNIADEPVGWRVEEHHPWVVSWCGVRQQVAASQDTANSQYKSTVHLWRFVDCVCVWSGYLSLNLCLWYCWLGDRNGIHPIKTSAFTLVPTLGGATEENTHNLLVLEQCGLLKELSILIDFGGKYRGFDFDSNFFGSKNMDRI